MCVCVRACVRVCMCVCVCGGVCVCVCAGGWVDGMGCGQVTPQYAPFVNVQRKQVNCLSWLDVGSDVGTSLRSNMERFVKNEIE